MPASLVLPPRTPIFGVLAAQRPPVPCETVLKRARDGDETAISQILEAQRAPMLHLAFSILRDRESAAQEIFVRARLRRFVAVSTRDFRFDRRTSSCWHTRLARKTKSLKRFSKGLSQRAKFRVSSC